MESSQISNWMQQALLVITRISDLINSKSKGNNTAGENLIYLALQEVSSLFPEAELGIFPYQESKNHFIPDSAITVRMSVNVFPESLAKEAINQHQALFPNNLPPAMFIPEGPATACIPLQTDDIRLGVLVIKSHKEGCFSQDEVLVLTCLQKLITGVILKESGVSGVYRSLARKEEELSSLRKASQIISSRLRLEETLTAILQMALEMTDAEYGIFRLIDRSGKYLTTGAIIGENLARPLVEAIPVDGNTVMSWVARERKPACITDLRSKQWRDIYYPLDAIVEMRSELAIPMIGANGRLEGVLNLESRNTGAFSEQDSHLMQTLATQAVIAIQETRLLDALQEVARCLLTQSATDALNRITGLACELLNSDVCAIWSRQYDDLVLSASSGYPDPSVRFSIEGSFPGKVLLYGNSRSINSGEHIGLEVDSPGTVFGVPLHSNLAGQANGVMIAYRLGGDELIQEVSDWDQKVLTSLAYYAALSYQNASHQEALRLSQQQHAIAETFAATGDIAANVLHNLNNKVGTIPVRIQGIRDKRGDLLQKDSYLLKNLDEIEASANEAMESVRENLSHLRPISVTEVNVAECVKEACQSVHLPLKMEISWQNLELLPPVIAGKRSLVMAFTNLFGNAAEAMDSDGKLFITGRQEGNFVEVIITDTGPGIPIEIQERIFELNFSARSSSKGNKLGFGLWWVKTLMVRLGGSIHVESDGQHGASFHMKLPIVGWGA